MKKLLKFLTSRFFIVSISILSQVAFLVIGILYVSQHFIFFAGLLWLLSVAMVLIIINKQSNPAVKIPWILLITLLPIFGGLFYVIFGSSKLRKKEEEMLLLENTKIRNEYPATDPHIAELFAQNAYAASQSKYIKNITSIPLYNATHTTYYPLGDDFYPALLDALESAEHYIFMEYFIIAQGFMWQSIENILIKKAKAGLDVRLMYDDVGSVNTVPYQFAKKMTKAGVPTIAFNPYRPALRTILHNRDHRKICVIDGHTAFTGGINLADEYINKLVRFGHWKDSGVKLVGDVAYSFALIFLELWGMYNGIENDYTRFKMTNQKRQELIPLLQKQKGFVQPYSDTPLDTEHTGEQIYLNVINQATRYCYITTPYFIVDNELLNALQLAAKRSVDVRIITPHVPDKYFVHQLTRANYRDLIESGVRVFEYTPGFMHSKMIIADDSIATNGTVNMDFRSLYHHFECGVWFYKVDAISDMKKDFVTTLESCEEITVDFFAKRSLFTALFNSLLRIFAPLL